MIRQTENTFEMIKRLIAAIIFLTLSLGGVIGFKLYKRAAIRDYLATAGTAAVPLNATIAEPATWEQRLEAIGTLRARSGIDIRSEVNAVIRAVHVESRQQVQAGDLLVELDDTVDRATLKSARVRLDKAAADFQRDSALFERSLVSEDQFEDSRSEYQSAQALVEEIQGIIDKKTIRAPFAGTVGIHSLSTGQYLEQGGEILTLQALDTLYLDLNLPEKELERLQPGQAVLFTVPTHGQRKFSGRLRFIDARIEETTRNVLVRAEVDNSDRALLPGMFAKASVVLEEVREVVTLPREAVAFSLYGETVYVLEQTAEGWVARRRGVSSGEIRDGRIAVDGLQPGQIVALDTQNRLLEGSPVVIANHDALGDAVAADSP